MTEYSGSRPSLQPQDAIVPNIFTKSPQPDDVPHPSYTDISQFLFLYILMKLLYMIHNYLILLNMLIKIIYLLESPQGLHDNYLI